MQINKMKIRVTSKSSFSLIEILADNGMPASAQNPIDEAVELDCKKPEAFGRLAVISGMPGTAQNMVTYHYKNCFGAIALANPKMGVAFVIGSTSPEYKVGQQIPLG
jgi:hypothetical protein